MTKEKLTWSCSSVTYAAVVLPQFIIGALGSLERISERRRQHVVIIRQLCEWSFYEWSQEPPAHMYNQISSTTIQERLWESEGVWVKYCIAPRVRNKHVFLRNWYLTNSAPWINCERVIWIFGNIMEEGGKILDKISQWKVGYDFPAVSSVLPREYISWSANLYIY